MSGLKRTRSSCRIRIRTRLLPVTVITCPRCPSPDPKNAVRGRAMDAAAWASHSLRCAYASRPSTSTHSPPLIAGRAQVSSISRGGRGMLEPSVCTAISPEPNPAQPAPPARRGDGRRAVNPSGSLSRCAVMVMSRRARSNTAPRVVNPPRATNPRARSSSAMTSSAPVAVWSTKCLPKTSAESGRGPDMSLSFQMR